MSGLKTTVGWALLLLAVMAAVAVPLSSTAGPARKAGAPIILSITPDDVLEPGKIAEFTVTAQVLVDASDFLLHVDLPDTLALFSGDRQWRGPVSRGSRQRLRFAVRIPESGTHRITVSGSIRTASGGILAAQEIYEIGPNSNRGTKSADRPFGIPHGEGVREYELP